MTTILSPRFTLTVYQTALAALRAGISFIPIANDGTKSPVVKWKEYQQRMPTLNDARRWFLEKDYGIAFLTGAVSGGLEMIDFDSYEVYEQFAEQMRLEGLGLLLDRIEQGYKERSPNGIHLYYKCALIEGNKKLAQRPLQEPPWVKSKIETRGEGGYSIGAWSGSNVHPSGRPYQLLQGSLATIQRIAPEDRALLLAVARTFDEMPPSQERGDHRPQKTLREKQGQLPGDIFNQRAMWHEILEPYGWTWVKRIGDEDFWRRPGKEMGISATTNYEGGDYLYVFSTSTIFEPCVGISKFAALTFLEYAGDFSASTKALAAQGYVDEKNKYEFTRYYISSQRPCCNSSLKMGS